jgi:hypothetical protein
MPRGPQRAARAKRQITLWGWDLYIVAFFGIGATFVLIGIYWIFFSSLPIPKFCRASYRNSSICGWIDHSGRETSMPWADRPSGVRRPSPDASHSSP